MRKFLLLALAVTFFATACSKSEETPAPAESAAASAEASPAAPAAPAAAPSANP